MYGGIFFLGAAMPTYLGTRQFIGFLFRLRFRFSGRGLNAARFNKLALRIVVMFCRRDVAFALHFAFAFSSITPEKFQSNENNREGQSR